MRSIRWVYLLGKFRIMMVVTCSHSAGMLSSDGGSPLAEQNSGPWATGSTSSKASWLLPTILTRMGSAPSSCWVQSRMLLGLPKCAGPDSRSS
eukprot:CAMPEP_0181523374 /NCGR_PEP_ID=MMETSP1110-20121109/67866_1 /TAXON_ID=174948 /ORGANISM="Symbiodinium sp., Strain CCMP421" /LENGTH=92 /DNA_ID=CAMNT_0023654039 /DNA_START=605 /DNA_END=880 /DNA_ORIENTATION=-